MVEIHFVSRALALGQTFKGSNTPSVEYSRTFSGGSNPVVPLLQIDVRWLSKLYKRKQKKQQIQLSQPQMD
jgi:hypothetical protein